MSQPGRIVFVGGDCTTSDIGERVEASQVSFSEGYVFFAVVGKIAYFLKQVIIINTIYILYYLIIFIRYFYFKCSFVSLVFMVDFRIFVKTNTRSR